MSNHPAFSKDRRVYSLWFLEASAKDPYKSHLISVHGQKYYDEVMRIYQERVDKNDFNIGPQSEEDWAKLKEKLNE